MTTQVEIRKTEGAIEVRSPFCKGNNETFRSRGGKWTCDHWKFENIPNVTAMLDTMFGEESKLCRVRIGADHALVTASDGQWTLGGYVLAERRYRDGGVKMPNGVSLTEGHWLKSGGSVKSPRVTGENVVMLATVRHSFAIKNGLELVEVEGAA